MRRAAKSFVFLLVIALFSSGLTFGQVAKEADTVSLKDALKMMLQAEGATGLKKLTVNVGGDQAEMLTKEYGIEAEGSYTVYKGTNSDGSVIGTVLIVNQEGKEGPLQVLVAVRPDGSVYDVGFTVFGEDKGRPALTWSFLRQYMGKKASDKLRLGQNVDGISGATMTSTSITTAVQRGMAVYTNILSAEAS